MFVIRDAPLVTHADTRREGGEEIYRTRELQPLIDVCLLPERSSPGGRTLWFPAVVDTGHSHNLSLNERQLRVLAQRPLSDFPTTLPPAKVTSSNGAQAELPRHPGNLWVRSNVPGQPPLCLELDRGFTYYARGGPPVPIVGCHALATAGLQVAIDFPRMRFSLTRCRKRFGEWLVERGVATPAQLAKALDRQAAERADGVAADHAHGRLACLLRCLAFNTHLGIGVGEFARELGLISDDQLSGLSNHTSPAGPFLVGETLVQMGIVDEATLRDELSAYRATAV